MVIVNYEAGQLGNRLFHFAHFIANSKYYKYRLVYPYFEEYKCFFEDFETNAAKCNISLSLIGQKFLNRKLLKVLRSLDSGSILVKTGFLAIHDIGDKDNKGEDFDMSDPKFVLSCKCDRVLTRGWLYRDVKHLPLFSEWIRKLFTPTKHYREEIESLIKSYRATNDVIVGVHIRRGDYRQFDNGKWFYKDETYLEKMMEVQSIFSKEHPGKSTMFHISSNDEVNLTVFEGINFAFKSRHFITDLYCLSSCDYIIGPPSTFSAWASFYGKVPLYHINDKDAPVLLEEFSVVKS
ncbi:alpha-1,2-fucosyltransferase [Desertivirga arenae]|uniref:alpha-1,2-fucosyltransferase n=1 Tax=Desertivirga arenae TaxID=2810309 RepID=UPI001A961C24|nr:alpha-1,2-fucosyltransferase [Pedobacter sp. SYSU D00823]